MKDSNPVVRKAGVTGTGKVFRHSPNVIEDNDMINMLYSQLKDPDPTVLTFAMQTLNIILESEGGIVINNNMCKYLVKRFPEFPELEICFVFEYLLKYFCPRSDSSDERKLYLMNAIDQHLESKNWSIFLSSCALFFGCIKNLSEENRGPRLKKDFLAKIKPQFCKFLKPSSQVIVQDFQGQMLEFFQDILHDGKESEDVLAFAKDVSSDLKLKSKDLSKLKRKKIEVLQESCKEEDAKGRLQYFLDELQVHSDICEILISSAISLSKAFPQVNDSLLASFVQGDLKLDSEKAILKKVRQINFHEANDETSKPLLLRLCRTFLTEESFNQEETLIINFLWILNHHSSKLEDSPYYLEQFLDEHTDKVIKFNLYQPLLLASVKIFGLFPASSQHLLGEVFSLCNDSGQPEMLIRVKLYARILKNYEATKQILL